jgi:hypothetical protein
MAFTDDIAKLAFEQSAKALTAQVATVDNVRARIGVILGSGNVATAFLGKDVITRGVPTDGEPSTAFLIGAGAFVVFVLACLYGLIPRGDWGFDVSSDAVLSRGEPGSGMADMGAVYRDLAKWQEYYFDGNADRLKGLWTALGVAIVAIAVELVAFGFVVLLEGGSVS